MLDYPIGKEIMKHKKFENLTKEVGFKNAKLFVQVLTIEGEKPYLTPEQQKRFDEIKERVK